MHMDKDFGEKVWWINRLVKRLLIVTTNLDDGKSLMFYKTFLPPNILTGQY